LPGGGTGFVFSEETDEARRIYKRWAQRPEYLEVRALALAVLGGKAQPIEDIPHKPVPAAVGALGAVDDEAVPQEIKDLRLDPQAENIVFTAWKLRGVQADVTELARIAPGDTVALDEYLRVFNSKYPRASVTAGELSDIVSTAKPEHVRAACAKLATLTPRSAYFEFALLTALNTRDRDIPTGMMMAFAKSRDFMVRQTTALLLARHGQMYGLEMFFDEIANADPRGCELLAGALDELLGHVLDSPPNSKAADAVEKLKQWKSTAANWRAANLAKLEFNPNTKAGEACWVKK